MPHKMPAVLGNAWDFGDTPNDANFVCDGIVSADRIPHPACHEHHRLAQPVSVSFLSARGCWQNLGIDRGLDVRCSHPPPRLRRARDGSVAVTIAHEATTPARRNWRDVALKQRIVLFPDGRLEVRNEFFLAPDYADLPRVGVRIDLVPGLSRLTYYGRGDALLFSVPKASGEITARAAASIQRRGLFGGCFCTGQAASGVAVKRPPLEGDLSRLNIR